MTMFWNAPRKIHFQTHWNRFDVNFPSNSRILPTGTLFLSKVGQTERQFRKQVVKFSSAVSFVCVARSSRRQDLWVFHLKTRKWEKVAATLGPSARSGHRMVLCKRQLVVFGGYHDNGYDYKYFNDVHVFDLDARTWRKVPPSMTHCITFSLHFLLIATHKHDYVSAISLLTCCSETKLMFSSVDWFSEIAKGST